MATVVLVIRAEMRARWRAWLGLALIAGLGAGAALALLGGARRTDRNYPRFVEAQRAADVILTGANTFGLVGGVDLGRVERLPLVEQSARAFAAVVFTGRTEDGVEVSPGDIFPVAAADTTLGRDLERWKMLHGRRADPGRADEAVASFELAERYDLHVGSTLDLRFARSDTFAAMAARLLGAYGDRLQHGDAAGPTYAELVDGPRLRLRIVGIEASPAEFPPLLTDLAPVLHLTPEFFRRHGATIVGAPVSYMRLRPGGDLTQLEAEVERFARGQPVSFVSTERNQTEKVQRSARADSAALAIVALLIGLTTAVVVAQAFARYALLEAGHEETMRGLGMTPRRLLAVSTLRASTIAVPAAAVAVAVAVLASPWTVTGVARTAELDEGVHFDSLVAIVGAVLTFVWVLVVGTVAARWATTRGRRPASRSIAGAATARPLAAAPPALGIGARFALDRGRARSGAPVWTAVLGTACAIALVTAAVIFSTSIERIVSSPNLYGWNWGIKIGAPGLPDVGGIVTPALESDPAVTELAAGTSTQFELEGTRVDVLGMDVVDGDALPTIVDGRPPARPSEIVLGVRTMRDLGLEVGDVVRPRLGTRSALTHIVGSAVFHDFGDAGSLGTGAFMTYEGLVTLLPTAQQNIFFVGVRGGDRDDEQRIADALAPLPHRFDGRPEDLDNLASVDGPIAALGLVVAALGVAVLAHSLVTSVRRRWHDLGVLRALGFGAAQLRTVVLSQGTTLALIALAVGIPAGIVGGRVAWAVLRDDLGVPAPAVVSGPTIAIVVTVGLLVALLVAAVPAWLAARGTTASALRRE